MRKHSKKIRIAKQSASLLELGATGLKRYGGIIREEFLRELQGQKGIKALREMQDNDPVIGAVLLGIKTILRRVSWTEQSASQNPVDLEASDFLASNREDMSNSWQDLIAEIMSMLTFGWAYHEIVLKRRDGENRDPSRNSRFSDGKLGWRKLPIRAQETLYKWEFDETGGIQGMTQQDPASFRFVTIPIERALLFRTTTEKNNPEGRSLLRNSYVSWFRKRMVEFAEGVGVERDLAGFPVAWVPPEILAKSASGDFKTIQNEIRDLMANIRRDEQEFLIWPLDYDEKGNKRWDFTLVSSGGTRQFNTNEIINRYDQRMAMSMLADVMLIGAEKVGSFALSQTKMELFSMGLEALADSVEAVFNRIAIPRLFSANGMKLERLPQLKHGKVERVDIKELGDYIQRIAAAGIPLFPDDQLENYLRTVGGMPPKPEEG